MFCSSNFGDVMWKPAIKMKQNKQQSQSSSDFNYLHQETNVRIDLGAGQKENII